MPNYVATSGTAFALATVGEFGKITSSIQVYFEEKASLVPVSIGEVSEMVADGLIEVDENLCPPMIRPLRNLKSYRIPYLLFFDSEICNAKYIYERSARMRKYLVGPSLK